MFGGLEWVRKWSFLFISWKMKCFIFVLHIDFKKKKTIHVFLCHFVLFFSQFLLPVVCFEYAESCQRKKKTKHNENWQGKSLLQLSSTRENVWSEKHCWMGLCVVLLLWMRET
jgi:hypothetical protein